MKRYAILPFQELNKKYIWRSNQKDKQAALVCQALKKEKKGSSILK